MTMGDKPMERPERLLKDQTHLQTSFSGNFGDLQEYLIFFVSGNPGLISFYGPFLQELQDLLEQDGPHQARFHIHGHSYDGFELGEAAEKLKSPIGLEQQVENQEKWLMRSVKQLQSFARRPVKVILIGHSVGSYVLLELIQRHLDAVEHYADVDDFDLIGGILLFPTIAEIGKSPLGKFARLILPLPGFARLVGAFARVLVHVLPTLTTLRLIRWITRFPDYAATTTLAFLQSSMGVRQALYLAKDEMRMIKEDDWDNEVWGASTSPGTNKLDTANWNLTLFWGQHDQWVAARTRDNIIAARGPKLAHSSLKAQEPKCNMIIDSQGIPHDFCTTLKNSYIVAGKVKTWIDNIIDKHSTAI